MLKRLLDYSRPLFAAVLVLLGACAFAGGEPMGGTALLFFACLVAAFTTLEG